MVTKTIRFILIFSTILITINSQSTCGKSNPSTITDCTNSSTQTPQTTSCCLLKSSSISFCQELAISTTTNSVKVINGTTYNIDCGSNENVGNVGNVGNVDRCLAQNSNVALLVNKYFCTQYSTETNSCCLYSQYGRKRCQWLNAKFDGDIEMASISYQCYSGTLMSYYFILVFYLSCFI